MELTRTARMGIMIAGGVIILSILASFFGLTLRQRDMINNYILLSARAYFESILITRRWNANYDGVYVLKEKGVESNPYLEHPDITARDGRVYTKKNPALMTREISDMAKQYGSYQYHITSLNLLNPKNVPDPWEREVLLAFEKGVEEVTQITEMNGSKVFRLMRPLLYEKGCVSCHAKQGYKLGDVRGGISVALPYGEIETQLKGNTLKMLGLASAIIIVMGGVFYLLVWQLMRRLTKAISSLGEEKVRLQEAQSDLERERDKLDDIVSSLDADLLLLDRDMRIVWINKRLKERAPYSRGDIVGQICNQAYCNMATVPEDCPAKLCSESGKPIRQEHPIIHPDGVTRYYSFTCSPIKDREGTVVNVLELVQDITERHAMEETIRKNALELAKHTAEIEDKNRELEEFNKLFVEREFRIKELRERVRELEGR